MGDHPTSIRDTRIYVSLKWKLWSTLPLRNLLRFPSLGPCLIWNFSKILHSGYLISKSGWFLRYCDLQIQRKNQNQFIVCNAPMTHISCFINIRIRIGKWQQARVLKQGICYCADDYYRNHHFPCYDNIVMNNYNTFASLLYNVHIYLIIPSDTIILILYNYDYVHIWWFISFVAFVHIHLTLSKLLSYSILTCNWLMPNMIRWGCIDCVLCRPHSHIGYYTRRNKARRNKSHVTSTVQGSHQDYNAPRYTGLHFLCVTFFNDTK